MFSATPQPPKNLFCCNNTQRGSSAGNLFANSSSLRSASSLFPDPPKSSLFQQIPNPFQKSAPPASKEVPIYGTVDHIGKSHIYKTPLDDSFACITGAIKNCSLDELRIQDYYNTRRNLLPPTKKQLVDTAIYKNSSKRLQGEFMNAFNPSGGQNNPFLSGGIFGRNQSSSQTTANPGNTQPSSFCGGVIRAPATSGNLFANPQKFFCGAAQPPKTSGSSFISQQQAPTNIFCVKPAQNNQVSTSQNLQNLFHQAQSKENIPKKQEFSFKPVQQATSAKSKEEVSEKQSVASKPGCFSYEVNKMVLVSSFVSLLRDHKVSVPENILDETDFVPQLFKFLEGYNMNLPTENIPKFPLNTLTSLPTQPSRTENQPQTSPTTAKKIPKKASQRGFDKKPQEEKPMKMKTPLKEVSVVESSSNVGKKEEVKEKEGSVLVMVVDRKKLLSEAESPSGSEQEDDEERVEIQDETSSVPKCQFQDEESVVQSFEEDHSEIGMESVDFSDDEWSDEEEEN